MRNFGMSNRPVHGGRIQAGPRNGTSTRADLNFDERELGAITFALCCAASPFVVVGLVIFGYRLYVALVGLPA